MPRARHSVVVIGGGVSGLTSPTNWSGGPGGETWTCG